MNQYFVWLTEYPDEGSLLLAARDSRQARKRGRSQIADGDKETELTVVRATEQQAHRWGLDLHVG